MVAVGLDEDDHVGRVLDQRAEARLALPGGGLLEQPHVLADGHHLPDHHEEGDRRGANDEAADRIAPGMQRRRQTSSQNTAAAAR